MPEKTRPPGGRAPDARIEKSEYTEKERLGLDDRVHELRMRDESVDVARIPHDVYYAGNGNLEKLNKFLALYGLNSGVYDEKENPNGIATAAGGRSEAQTAETARTALVTLLQVPADITRWFFGLTRGRKNKSGEERLSPAFVSALTNLRERQLRHPLEHPEEYRQIGQLLRNINHETGLSPLDIFKPDSIPPLHATLKLRSLRDYLYTYSLLVSGRYTRHDLSQRENLMVIVADALTPTRSTVFTEEAIAIARRLCAKDESD